jgi:hypothetical protein
VRVAENVRRHRAAVVALVLAVGAAAAVVHVGAIDRRDDTRAAQARSLQLLGDERTAIDRLHADRTVGSASLASAERALVATSSDRHAAGDERAGAQSAHDAAAAELDRVRAAVAAAEGQASAAQAEADRAESLTSSLATCLAGVSQLLNQLSVGDDAGAVATARRIRGACAVVDVAVTA